MHQVYRSKPIYTSTVWKNARTSRYGWVSKEISFININYQHIFFNNRNSKHVNEFCIHVLLFSNVIANIMFSKFVVESTPIRSTTIFHDVPNFLYFNILAQFFGKKWIKMGRKIKISKFHKNTGMWIYFGTNWLDTQKKYIGAGFP